MAPDAREPSVAVSKEASDARSCVHLRRVVPRYVLTNSGYHQGYSRVFDERQMSWGNTSWSAITGLLLGVLVWDNCAHGGQIAYLGDYYEGMGWPV